MTTGQTCCANGGACDASFKCCGAFNCAPEGGECCSDGGSCHAGLHCVILNGVPGCCKDLSCTEFGSGGAVSALTSFTITPISFTPISVTPITIPSFTPLTFPSITLPTPVVRPATDRVHYSYFTTTWTWYYYSYFITTFPPSIQTPTSTRVTTSTTLSAYATDSSDAKIQFESITLAAAVPTAVTAPGFTAKTATLTATSSTATAPRAGGTASNTSILGFSGGTASAGARSMSGFATLLLGSCLGLGIGSLVVWL